ncbi:MAG: type II toxin-antitoxin system RelE/ParE family toxin [Flavobacteriaceae bacterium]|nr:type II toxin-antitoxin system RelE/ParE family toxin [Flavobacteriaceae bacterium]
MYKALILPIAKLDISEAVDWYNSKQKGLGKRFIKEVRSKVLFIRENPKASTVRYDGTRCAILDVFPFMIHYKIDKPNKTIIIAAVFHTSLSPERWKKR